jgi:pentatricopeptide repeat protein
VLRGTSSKTDYERFQMHAGSFVEPDDIVFAILIRGYGQASNPPDWTSVARLLSRMQAEFDVKMTINVYNALLELCAASNDLVRAEELLSKMEAQGIQPNEYTEAALEAKRALRTALRRTFKHLM